MGKKNLRKVVRIGIGLIILVFFIYSLLLLSDPITTIFNINAITERISISSIDENGSELNLDGVDIYGTGLKPLYKGFIGQFKLNKDVSVTVERVAYGSATLTFRAPKGQKSGTLYDRQEKLIDTTGHYLEIAINNLRMKADSGQTFIFSFDGKVSLGRSVDHEVGYESTALLRSGNINMTGTSTWSDNFDAGTIQLYLGDEIQFHDQSENAIGFITLNENPGMQVAYRVVAKQATILKPGPKMEKLEVSGVNVSATSLDRISKASLFQIISLFFSILLIATNLIAFLIDVYTNKKNLSTLFK
ncbi:hypothetical protein [Spirosoma aerolatum]|uniref:hypothetical protein n=1 Tax=Spirosoma aerolatum TaxID=1211326 RepID=UPI0009AEBC5A|nr:hypothetical protein [Spirosoma aerolatum]